MPRDDSTFVTLGTLAGKAGKLAPIWALRGVPADAVLGIRETGNAGNRPTHSLCVKVAGQVAELAALWESDEGRSHTHSGKVTPEAALVLGLPMETFCQVYPPRDGDEATRVVLLIPKTGASSSGHRGGNDPFDDED